MSDKHQILKQFSVSLENNKQILKKQTFLSCSLKSMSLFTFYYSNYGNERRNSVLTLAYLESLEANQTVWCLTITVHEINQLKRDKGIPGRMMLIYYHCQLNQSEDKHLLNTRDMVILCCIIKQLQQFLMVGVSYCSDLSDLQVCKLFSKLQSSLKQQKQSFHFTKSQAWVKYRGLVKLFFTHSSSVYAVE